MPRASWPLMTAICDFTQGPPGIPGNGAVSLLDDPASRLVFKGFTTSRGRQYELGTVQAGELKLTIDDPQEWLNPVNTSSPLNSGANQLLPYRQIQIGAWWNKVAKDTSGNLLNSTNLVPGSSNTYDPSFEGGGLGGFFGFIGAPTITNSTAQAFNGTRSLSCQFNGATDTPTVALFVPPYQQQTLSLYVFVPVSHTVTAKWFNFTSTGVGTLVGQATSSLTGAWQRLIITGTPATPTNVLELTCTGALPATVYVDAIQLQLGAAATPFGTTGPTYLEVYTGYIERYPQQWEDKGFRGVKPLEAVDALSPLSRTIISQSYAATVLADGPAVFAPYDDDAFPQTILRPTGGQPYVGYQATGSQSASVNFGGDTFLDGSRAVSLSQQNADPLTSGDITQTTRLGTRYGSLMMNPQAFSYEVWVRWTAGQTWSGAGSSAFGESTTNAGLHDGPSATFGIRTDQNRIATLYTDTNGVTQFSTNFVLNTPAFADQYWHHMVVTAIGSNQWRSARDNVLRVGTYNVANPPAMRIDNIYHYVNTFYGDIISTASFAKLAIYNFALSPAQIAAHYQRGIGYLGEKSGVRALRLLTQYWSTAVVTDTGVASMAADFSYDGRAMLDVLQEIADTEAGLVWVDTAGVVHQDSRETRYTAATSTTSQFTFGENAAGGELPYTDLKYDYDPTYVYSQANFTSGGTSTQLPPVVNAATQAAVGQRVLPKTLQMAVDWDVAEAAKFYVQRYAKPAGAPGTGVPPRISGMTIDPSSNPDLWAAALTLDVGQRVTVKRRTATVTISGDYYIEQVNHNNTGSKWTVQYQLSPVFVSQPWVLGDAVKGVLGTTTVCVY